MKNTLIKAIIKITTPNKWAELYQRILKVYFPLFWIKPHKPFARKYGVRNAIKTYKRYLKSSVSNITSMLIQFKV
jgi:hypothetical protein